MWLAVSIWVKRLMSAIKWLSGLLQYLSMQWWPVCDAGSAGAKILAGFLYCGWASQLDCTTIRGNAPAIAYCWACGVIWQPNAGTMAAATGTVWLLFWDHSWCWFDRRTSQRPMIQTRSLSDLAVLQQNTRDRIKWAYHKRKMVVPFDEYDKYSLSIFVSFEQNMLNPTGS